MAGEAIDVLGTYTSCLGPASVPAGGFSGESSSITTTLGATDAQYVLLDMQLDVTVTTPTAGIRVNVYRRPSDGVSAQSAPSGTYKHEYVGSFVLDAAFGKYYLRSIPKGDPNDTFYLYNDDANALTLELLIRARSMKAA